MSRAKTLCPDCFGYGSAVIEHGVRDDGATFTKLSQARCPTCMGRGHLDKPGYARSRNRASTDNGLRSDSLGKLVGVSEIWPHRNERPKG